MATKQPISMRLRAGLRDRVWVKATAEGKSLNEMVNDLLERGLEADRQQAQIFGSVAGFNVARALLAAAEASVVKEGGDQGVWLYEPEAFNRASAAIMSMLDMLRPAQEAPSAVAALAEIDRVRKLHDRGARHG
jgi:hypothetical protein